ncbi:DUF7352 domain-containing protein [Marinobacter sp. F4206]|uniref:DUF7352 domain-containing protein n=1 Tax=Marinobacter sp. F4206 TaxID=2861777 RepID=UPI001C607CE8|nr:hypothetical protein [Marinobacter sp. F4206]MBW4936376.1 hypothetical protein [Marinobacter sp. F4206]
MKTIHKFRLEPGKEPTTLPLREGSRVVRCEYLVPDKSVYLWVEQPLSIGARTLERQFRVAFSGEPVPDNYVYLDTALDPFGPEAYHVFELPAADHELGTRGAGADVLSGTDWRQTALS